MMNLNLLKAWRRWRDRRALERAFNAELVRQMAFRSGALEDEVARLRRKVGDIDERGRQLMIERLRIMYLGLQGYEALARELGIERELRDTLDSAMRLAASAARQPLAWERGHREPYSENFSRPEYSRWVS